MTQPRGSASAAARSEILVVDDDEDVRLALGDIADTFCARGWVGAGSAADVVALGPRASGFGLAIIDVNLGAGEPSGIEVLKLLRDSGFHGKAVFLTGHAQSHPTLERVASVEGVPVLAKPLGLDAVLALIESAP
jgi:DNA-binding NtrC family response regulator